MIRVAFRKHVLRWLLVAGVVSASAIWGWLRLRGAPVLAARASRRAIAQTVVSSGRVLAPTQITLASFVSSTVVEVVADEGQRVQAGQLLARLDDRELAAAERRAQALVARASAGALQVRKLSLPAARERLRQSELSLAQARREVAQSEALARERALAPSALDEARTQLGVAESQVQAARLQLEAAAALGSETLSAAAAREQAGAELASARLALERTRVIAPLDGMVLERGIAAGDSVQPGARLFVISGTGNTRLVIEPDERNLALLRIGQRARASAEAFPERGFDAELSYIAPAVDARRGTIEVRLSVPDPPAYLKPDMTISAEVEVAAKPDAIVVPAGALHALSSSRPFVFVIDGGRASRRVVQIGIADENHIEIARGLRPGDAVLVDAPAGLQAGDRVRPRWAEP